MDHALIAQASAEPRPAPGFAQSAGMYLPAGLPSTAGAAGRGRHRRAQPLPDIAWLPEAGQPRLARPAKMLRILCAIARRPVLGGAALAFACANAHRFPIGIARLALKPFRPFACARWQPAEKLDRMRGHLAIVTALGGVFAMRRGPARVLAEIPLADAVYRLTLDEPRVMLDDGLTALSLWHEGRRLFSLTFVFSDEGGRRVARIGGIQGRAGEGVLDRYRLMTRQAFGLRPRDLLLEAFRMLCGAIGVDRILAVADHATYHSDPYFGDHPLAVTRLDYDAVWRDRGGRRCGDWYDLPVGVSRRPATDVPMRKRALYRRRYALLDTIAARIGEALVRSGVMPHASWCTAAAPSARLTPPRRRSAQRRSPGLARPPALS